jgi:hypothetical protein
MVVISSLDGAREKNLAKVEYDLRGEAAAFCLSSAVLYAQAGDRRRRILDVGNPIPWNPAASLAPTITLQYTIILKFRTPFFQDVVNNNKHRVGRG